MRLELPCTEIALGAREIVERLRGAGHEAYLVGGCVRSLWLGEEPKDYDIATAAHPEAVQNLFEKTIPVGIAFGVLIVRHREHSYEVATFRSDGCYLDRRRPEVVTFSSAREDALRRDFTINALLWDPSTGEVIDHVGGVADLEARIIRTVGEPNERFGEDALRLMRAIRFAARCDCEIEPRTRDAIKRLAETIEAISPERIGDEIVRLLTGPHAGRGLRLLNESGLLDHVLPEVAAMRGVPQPPEYHPEGDVFTHTVLCLDHLPQNPSPAIALATLLHDIGKPPTFEEAADRIRFHGHDSLGAEMAIKITRRLRLPTALGERVGELVRCHMRFKDMPRMRTATLKRFLFREDFEDHLEVHRCDVLGSLGEPEMVAWCRERLEELERAGVDKLPQPLLTGHDLISMGLEPGPIFGEILESLQTEQLDGNLDSKAEAEAFVRSRWKDLLHS